MRFLALLVVIVAACGDDAGDDGAPAKPDATVPQDARTPDDPIDARVPLDASVDAQLPPSGPLDAAQLPTDPASLSVQLQRTACFGTCPSYRLRVDQAGQVSFVGGFCTARPGVFAKTVAAAGVKSFYDQLRASPYFALGNSYADVTSCPSLVSDHAAQIWDVVVDGVRKPLTRDEGCMGIPELAQIDTLVPQLAATTDVQSWIGDGQNCELFKGDAPLDALASTYRIARDGKPLAMLRFADNKFELDACDGAPIATGTPLKGTYTMLLIDEHDAKLRLGTLELGSIVLLQPSENEAVVAYGLRESDELALGIVEAERCTAN